MVLWEGTKGIMGEDEAEEWKGKREDERSGRGGCNGSCRAVCAPSMADQGNRIISL